MNTKLTLFERRKIAKETIPMKKLKDNKLQGWALLLTMTHKHETYDFFGVPKFRGDVDEYYKNNPKIANL